jgi:hypothetical protein
MVWGAILGPFWSIRQKFASVQAVFFGLPNVSARRCRDLLIYCEVITCAFL